MAPETREKIVYKAIEYFAKNNYDKASLNDIAGALNITKGGIYHYFESKDHLFRESMIFVFRAMEEMFLAMFDEDVDIETVLKLLADPVSMGKAAAQSLGLDFFSDTDNLLYLMFTAIKKFPELRAELSGIYLRMADWCEEILRQGQKTGNVRVDLDAKTMALQLIALSEGSLLLLGIIPEFDHRIDSNSMIDNIMAWILP